jgi:hypothetical protein
MSLNGLRLSAAYFIVSRSRDFVLLILSVDNGLESIEHLSTLGVLGLDMLDLSLLSAFLEIPDA